MCPCIYTSQLFKRPIIQSFIHTYICWSVCLSICLSAFPFACLSVWSSAWPLSVWVSVSQFVCQSGCQSICRLFVCCLLLLIDCVRFLRVSLYVWPSVCRVPVCLPFGLVSILLPVTVCVCLSMCLIVDLFIHIVLSNYPSQVFCRRLSLLGVNSAWRHLCVRFVQVHVQSVACTTVYTGALCV